jgi:hypothetical protein
MRPAETIRVRGRSNGLITLRIAMRKSRDWGSSTKYNLVGRKRFQRRMDNPEGQFRKECKTQEQYYFGYSW